ncbi:MAG: pitrilysin family protein [Planctomycetota bacterium]
MFETFNISPLLTLHVRPITKFKTRTVKIFITRNLDNNATRAAILPFLLRRGTAKHPTTTSIAKKLENMYGTGLGTDVLKIGEWQVMEFSLEVASERFIPGKKRLFPSALSFLQELIFCPVTKNGVFRSNYLKTEVENMRRFIEGMINDKATYATEQLIKHMCGNEAFSIYEYGDLESLKLLEPESLYQYYRGIMDSNPIDVYVTGDLNPEDALGRIKKIFSFERKGGYSIKKTQLAPFPKTVKRFHERIDISQARLLIGFRTDISHNDDAVYPLILASSVFGGFPHSKLFRVVREEASLAYAVHSYLIRAKGIIIVYAGVYPAKAQEAETLIMQQFEEMKSGNISDFEIESTKKNIVDDLRAISDNASREINFAFVSKLNGSKDTPEIAIEKILSVTKNQIAEASRRMFLDTVYLLGPDKL